MKDLLSLPQPHSAPSLTEQTYEIIQNAILSLELRPGDPISVQRLSEQLGVSRTPVKDALLRLEQDGLVSSIPQKGTYVSSITIEDVEEILELRILLESYAAGRAAELLSPDELAEAEAILERMKDSYAAEEYFESATIGNQFHELLLSKVKNCRLISFLRQLDIQYTRIRHYLAIQSKQHSKSIDQHYYVLAALKAGDAQQATAAMADHLSSVREDIVSSLLFQDKQKNT